ncbi:MAG: hypothetical protein AB7Q69_01695 [Gemmatimonadales bacterium]
MIRIGTRAPVHSIEENTVGVFTFIAAIILAGILGDTIVKVAKARSGGADAGKLRGEVDELSRDVEELTAGLADAQATIAGQDAQIVELQERMDFTERMLARTRERPELGPGPGLPQ